MEKVFNIKFFLIISAFVLFINVGSFGVVETSDARYAEIAREMVVSNDYIHPNLLDIHHYHKPPFTYQITAIGYKIFGINSFGARFFLQIAVLIQVFLVYRLSLLLLADKKAAFLSAVCYFTMPLVLVSSRNLTTDAFLTMFAVASMYFWVNYRKNNKLLDFYLFYISLALGFLTKGPVIFIVPIIFIIGFNFIEKPKRKFGFHHILAFAIFLVLALSWYLYLAYYNSDFFNYFIGRQTVERFSKNVFNRTEPFWYFIVIAPLLGLPWLPMLPYLVLKCKSFIKFKSIYFVLILSFLFPLIFFSISSSKRPLYILPFYSLLSILITSLILKLNIEYLKKVNKAILFFSFILPLVFIIAPFVQTEYKISLFFIPISLLLILLLLFVFKSKKISYELKPFLMVFLTASFLVIGSSNVIALNELKINCPKPVTDFIINNNLQDRDILIFNRRLPSIAFGLNKSVISLNYGNSGLQRETQFETDIKWKNYLIDMKNNQEVEKLREILKHRQTVLIVYKHLPKDDKKWILKYYKNVKKMGKWYIFY